MAYQKNRRQGTVLIVVAGICALLAMLALAFLARMRSDSQEGQLLLEETRARVMFASALQYISETARIGWDDPKTPEKEEAFGWLDIRNGLPGPRDRFGNLLFETDDTLTCKGTKWPAIGSYMICNARLWRRPPTAVSQRVAANPIVHEPAVRWEKLVNYTNPDPMPMADNFEAFVAGDSSQVPGTDAPCWFRVYRKAPAVFIVSCGGGTSRGHKNWSEVQSSPDKGIWYSQQEWAMARANEPMLWYEVAWSPAVGPTSPGYIYASGHNNLNIKPATISKFFGGQPEDQQNRRNLSGTFLYRQRLQSEPDRW